MIKYREVRYLSPTDILWKSSSRKVPYEVSANPQKKTQRQERMWIMKKAPNRKNSSLSSELSMFIALVA